MRPLQQLPFADALVAHQFEGHLHIGFAEALRQGIVDELQDQQGRGA